MARRGGGRRTYVRDANGRFASTPGGGGGSKRPKTRMAEKGPNRLTRDNAGKITSQGGNGATVRGGRLKTAGGNLRGRVLAKGPKQGVAGTVAKPRGLKPGVLAARRGAKAKPAALTGKGRAPATRLPSANSKEYEYNKAGQIATPQERSRMRARDRAREKNAALADRQRAGALMAQRRAAKRMTSDQTEPGSVLRYSSTYNAAKNAQDRRSKRASENFKNGALLDRQRSALTAKAVKMQNQAAERKAQGKKITKIMEGNFQKLRRQIEKINRSMATRRKALEVIGQQSKRLEGSTKDRRR